MHLFDDNDEPSIKHYVAGAHQNQTRDAKLHIHVFMEKLVKYTLVTIK